MESSSSTAANSAPNAPIGPGYVTHPQFLRHHAIDQVDCTYLDAMSMDRPNSKPTGTSRSLNRTGILRSLEERDPALIRILGALNPILGSRKNDIRVLARKLLDKPLCVIRRTDIRQWLGCRDQAEELSRESLAAIRGPDKELRRSRPNPDVLKTAGSQTPPSNRAPRNMFRMHRGSRPRRKHPHDRRCDLRISPPGPSRPGRLGRQADQRRSTCLPMTRPDDPISSIRSRSHTRRHRAFEPRMGSSGMTSTCSTSGRSHGRKSLCRSVTTFQCRCRIGRAREALLPLGPGLGPSKERPGGSDILMVVGSPPGLALVPDEGKRRMGGAGGAAMGKDRRNRAPSLSR